MVRTIAFQAVNAEFDSRTRHHLGNGYGGNTEQITLPILGSAVYFIIGSAQSRVRFHHSLLLIFN